MGQNFVATEWSSFKRNNEHFSLFLTFSHICFFDFSFFSVAKNILCRTFKQMNFYTLAELNGEELAIKVLRQFFS